MIACFDVHYHQGYADAAAIVFDQWSDTTIVDQFVVRCTDVGEYQAGSFYRRELKPLQELLRVIHYPVRFYLIDAYCHLSDDHSPGLGAYLHDVLDHDSVVIGVAKNRFRNTRHAVELLRGGSQRPLFITSIGIDYQSAADYVQSMSGEHRIPTLLKAVDQLSRSGERT